MNTPTTSTRKRGAALLLLLMAFLLKCVSAQAQIAGFSDDDITLDVQNTGATLQSGLHYAGSQNFSPYDMYAPLGQAGPNTSVAAPQLGTFDLNNTSALLLKAATMRGTIGSSNTTLNSTIFSYRVYLASNTSNKPNYTDVSLTPVQTTGAFSGSTSTNIDLLSGLTSGGNYIIEVRYAVTITRINPNNGVSTTKTIYDLSGGADYFYAEFYVTPPPTAPPGGQTTWQSTNPGPMGDQWFVAANWSNGIPTAQSDAIIPENVPGSNIIFPVLNSRTVNYRVRNLTLNGTTNSGRAQLTIQAAVLHVYGNITQLSGGLVGTVTDRPGITDSTRNSTLILLGGNQTLTGNLSVPDIIIAGSGVKSIIYSLMPTNTLSFRPVNALDGVLVQTSSLSTGGFDTTGNSTVNLGSTGIINLGAAETITSYVKGVMLVNRPLIAGVAQRFGNIGLELTPNHPATQVTIQRIIGDPLIGPTASNGAARPVPIQRQYNIRGDDDSSTSSTAASSNTVVFSYLNSAFELNGINENNLMLFRSKTGSAPFDPYFGTLNTQARTVTQTNVESLSNYYLTLGDRTNPLPVTLVSFLATRTGNDAQLVWATASEKNNSGFEVQVSNDGKAFRTLSFVASQGSNSSTKLDYKYTDTEAGKAGVRYYRLHQIDLDGTDSYSPVRVVSFDGGAALASEVNIYPNPVTGDDTRLLIQTSEVGTAHLRVTDLMGRPIIDQNITTANGSTETKLTALANAKSGTYLAQLTLPSGQTKTIKVQKQ